MEYAGHKLGGATEDSWIKLKTLIDQYIDKIKDENLCYINENCLSILSRIQKIKRKRSLKTYEI